MDNVCLAGYDPTPVQPPRSLRPDADWPGDRARPDPADAGRSDSGLSSADGVVIHDAVTSTPTLRLPNDTPARLNFAITGKLT